MYSLTMDYNTSKLVIQQLYEGHSALQNCHYWLGFLLLLCTNACDKVSTKVYYKNCNNEGHIENSMAMWCVRNKASVK